MIAPDRRVAETSIRDLAASGAGPVFIDIPEPNAEGAETARALGLSPVFRASRMFRGRAPDIDLSRSAKDPNRDRLTNGRGRRCERRTASPDG